jgi:muramidase (phage lysozyme)
MAAALDLSVEKLNEKMAAGAIKSGPAVELLIDYWNKKYAGLMKFAGENTFEGLESSKRSAEASMMANAFAGGDVINPSADGAGATRLHILAEQIKRRDEMGKPGAVSDAIGELAAAYLKARDKDDEILFQLAKSSAADGIGSIVTKTATKVSNNMIAPPGFFLGESIGEFIGKKTGIKPLAEYAPSLNKLNPSWEDIGNIGSSDTSKTSGSNTLTTSTAGDTNLEIWAKSLFTTATASAINSVEQGKGPMKEAGATLGDATIQGMKSPKGLDSQSPSKRAIAEGLNVRLGLAQGLADPTINLSAAGAGLADEIFAGFRGARGVSGISQRDYLEQVSQNPTVKAFFEAIKKAEGGELHTMAGGRRVNSGPLHPGEVVPMSEWFRTSKGPSSAAGDYQITRTNWRSLAPELGLNNFSDPHQQYIAALKLFADRGGLPALLSGNINAAMAIAAKDWTSTPGSRIGGGKQLSRDRWMGFFNDAAGGSAMASGPIPVTIVADASSDGLKWRKWTPHTVDAGNSVPIDLNTGQPLRDISNAQRIFGQRRPDGIRTINDPVPVSVDIIASAEPLTHTFIALNEQALMLKKPLELLGESAATTAKNLGGLSEEEIAAKRAEALSAEGKKKAKRNKLSDPLFTPEGVAGDFQGGLQGLLSGLGWEKPTSLAKQFGISLLRDIQGRMAHDMSSMITGAIFGNRGEDGKLSGGLFGGKGFDLGSIFSKLFGGLFGGGRASGGGMSAGRFYMAGEHGPELVAGPGYVHNNRETRQMVGGGYDPQNIIFAIGDREVGRAVDAYRTSPRGRRAKLIQGKYGRKIMGYA